MEIKPTHVYTITTTIYTDYDTDSETAAFVLYGATEERAQRAFLEAVRDVNGIAATVTLGYPLPYATIATPEDLANGLTPMRTYDSRGMHFDIPLMPPRRRVVTPGPISVPEETLSKYLPEVNQ